MIHSRVTSKAQTTIPKPVRDALGVKPGDVLVYEIEDGRVVLRKAPQLESAYLEALGRTLSEWESPEDAAAYDDL
jgi:antitoxin PrlF